MLSVLIPISDINIIIPINGPQFDHTWWLKGKERLYRDQSFWLSVPILCHQPLALMVMINGAYNRVISSKVHIDCALYKDR